MAPSVRLHVRGADPPESARPRGARRGSRRRVAFRMKHTKRFRLVARLVLMLSVLGAAGASAFSLWPDSLPPTNLYRVVAYLDRAPSGANIRDRIRIRAQGFPERELIVTDYQTPGET